MINIIDKEDCCGCSACANACPTNCIAMIEDNEGFLYPKANEADCVSCGKCEKVCPIIQSKENNKDEKKIYYEKPKAVGGWIKDDEIRQDSSSGGAFTAFAKYILENGGVVYGAALCDDLVVRHIGIENINELARLRGSKYVQSCTGAAYKHIKLELESGRKVLFSGTPCQTSGLLTYLSGKNYDNLFLIDFICHGVPSPKVFSLYIDYLQKKYKDKITNFRFRLKDKNWNPIGLQLGTRIDFANKKSVRNYPAFKDSYMNGFLDDAYLRPSCYKCHAKLLPHKYSDITIADFWGVNKCYPELFDGKGTSLVLINNEHGDALLNLVDTDFEYKEVEFEKAVKRNPTIVNSAKKNSRRNKFFKDLEKKSFGYVRLKYMTAFSWGVHKTINIAWKILKSIIKKVVGTGLKIAHINWTEDKWEAFFQFVKFAMVGVSNVLVSYSINICALLFQHTVFPGFKWDYIAANITAFLLSVLWSFHWNSRKVFGVNDSLSEKLKSLLKSYMSYAFTGLILNNLLSTFWIHVVGVSKFISPLLNVPIAMPVNFFILKKWAFKK